MNYGERVRALRERIGLSQSGLGERIGCGRGHVSAVEMGRWRFGRETELALAKLAGVQLEYLAAAPLGESPGKTDAV